MAFTNDEINKVVGHLKYPVFGWAISTIKNRLDAITAQSIFAEARVRLLILNLDAVQTSMVTLRSRSGLREDSVSLASTGTTGGNTYFQGGTFNDLMREYKYWQNELAIATALNIQSSNSSRVVHS